MEVGWKKAIAIIAGKRRDCIVKVMIPDEARSQITPLRRCRADKAIILDAQDFEGHSIVCDTIKSIYDNSFEYNVGDIVYPREAFDTNRWHECSSGIYYFQDRERAVKFI